MKSLTIAEIDQVSATPTNILHVLRHFSEVTPEIVSGLLGERFEHYDSRQGKYIEATVSDPVIAAALSTPGSKFIPGHNLFSSPHHAIAEVQRLLREHNTTKPLIWQDGGTYWQIEMEHEYPDMIGTIGVVPLSSLTDEEHARVRQMAREKDGPVLKTLFGKTPPSTNKLACGIYKRKDTNRIYVTTYPGFVGGPPLPSSEQSHEQRQFSENFWNNMVFLG